ncbi:MAG: hypothetical protein EKK40_17265 [Bradyrhizobiaceae bacterium]|nr:MAG: hypothetical protein EKK40_17265 [Bradyrhizobiaceae bacterium]
MIVGFSLGVSLLALPALAQGVGGSGLSAPANPTVPPSLAPSGMGTPQAPVGHFQPRRDAVPQENNNPYQESPEDKALDRKIKSICRGC